MKYERLGRAGLKVSRICLGTAFRANRDEATCRRVIDRAVDLGCNFIDCANSYGRGRSEQILGRAVRGRRENLVITTKVWTRIGPGPNDAGLSRLHIMREVERSLTRLQTDYVDIYYLHHVDPDTRYEETLRAMEDLVRQGKVRYVGASNYRAWQVVELLWTASAHNWQEISCLQNRYNLLCRKEIEQDLTPVCEGYGLGLVAYSPLAVGLLTGRLSRSAVPPESSAWTQERVEAALTPATEAVIQELQQLADQRGIACATMALAWLLDRPALTAPIIGPDLPGHVDEAMAATDIALTDAERERLDRVSAQAGSADRP